MCVLFCFGKNMMAVSCTFYRHMLGDMVWTCHFPFLSRAPLIFYKDKCKSECNSKLGKHSFTRLDIAEPQLILYKR